MEASNPTSTNNTEDLLLPPLGWWKSYQDLLLSVLAPSKETTGLFTTNFLSAGTDSSSVDIKRIVENLAILFNNNNNNGNNSSLSISELQHTTA